MIVNKLWKYLTTSEPETPPGEIRSFMKQTLEASVTRACANCGAPGVDENKKDVGEICPSCGTKRPPLEPLGVIWTKHI